MEFKFKTGDPVKPVRRKGPVMTISSPVRPNNMFEKYFAPPRYYCVARGVDGLRILVFAERQLEAVATYEFPARNAYPEADSLFI